MYELISCSYFVNQGISNAVSNNFYLTNMTVAPVCSDDICVCLCLCLSVLINGMSKILKWPSSLLCLSVTLLK